MPLIVFIIILIIHQESFNVNGIKFNYSFTGINGGLHYSINGKVKNGTFVRIEYLQGQLSNTIIKLEVKE